MGKGGVSMGKNPGSSNMPPANNFNVNEDVSGINRRVKVLEERYTNLRGKFQLIEQNILHKNKTFFTEIKTLNLEITEVKKEINEVKDKILVLIKELESFARRESVDILKKYIDLWNPINFVTKNEIEVIVREVIDKMRRE